ncbi:hypothetical protein J437_LFUL015615 [Ladona fulva]|uniref:DDE Tnp4 domain-containing protein n=1 Tax=Ladona fulva TaxID=123851 RepID=A0A8K0KKN3_LADFU|nr:hypothetical protein J437_LFUL015615 [Ladona fulva]
MPGVIGAIDGTHIAIVPPTTAREHSFINRRNFHCKNMQILKGCRKVVSMTDQQPAEIEDPSPQVLDISPHYPDPEAAANNVLEGLNVLRKLMSSQEWEIFCQSKLSKITSAPTHRTHPQHKRATEDMDTTPQDGFTTVKPRKK